MSSSNIVISSLLFLIVLDESLNGCVMRVNIVGAYNCMEKDSVTDLASKPGNSKEMSINPVN